MYELGALLSLEYGEPLPAERRTGFGFPVFGSNGEVGRHQSALLAGPGVVVGRKGSVGKVTWSDEAFWPIDTTYWVSCPPEERRWLYWVLSWLPLHRLDTSTGIPGLNRKDVYELEVYRPEIGERRQIAQILDTFDTTIRETETLIDKLKAAKQGLLQDLLTHGIDASGQLRPSQSEAPQLYKESTQGWIPREWEIQRLDNTTATPICYGIVQVFEYVPSGVPVLAIRDLLGDYVTGIHRTANSIDAAYPRSRVQPGDVLLSIKGTIGRIGVVPPHFFGNISRDIALIRPTSAIRSQFLAQMLRSPIGQTIIKQAQVGTTRAEISITPLRKLEIAFPDLGEQVRIEEILESADIRLADEQAKLDKLRSQKTGLMDDLLTGRVRVTPLLESMQKVAAPTEV